MDPDIITLVVGIVGGVAVLGAGGWAVIRRKPQDRDDRTPRDQDSSSASGHPRSGTATKERPAAPSWGDTLSAPARPAGEKPATGERTTTGEQPAAASGEDHAPFDQERSSDAAASDAAADGAGTAPPETAPSDDTIEDTELEGTGPGVPLEHPEPAADRMRRLRERLSRSGSLGRGLLGLLSRGVVDEQTWDEVEETLLLADLGPDATDELMAKLKARMQVIGDGDVAAVREALYEELIAIIDPSADRRLAASRREAPDGASVPSVMLMVGVNGTGKTTTVGKLARVLVAEDRTVVLGAADTFRAAAADQLATWGSRVGVETIRSDRDGADPAAVAFDAVRTGIETDVDVVIIDTAGRLQNKKGLMDELGKVRRVAEKGLHGDGISEVLLVIDATTGQNGMQQARVFAEAVDVTGIVLTKLDGTAKGGIVVKVQRELGVPVKMVGLGEGMDDLAPFDPHGFVDALLET